MKLTQQQIEHFNREGWLFLPELFTKEETDFLAREAVNIYDANRPEVWREKSGAPRTAFAAHLYNEAFGVLAALDYRESAWAEHEVIGAQILAGNAKAAEVAAQAHALTAGRMTEEKLKATQQAA